MVRCDDWRPAYCMNEHQIAAADEPDNVASDQQFKCDATSTEGPAAQNFWPDPTGAFFAMRAHERFTTDPETGQRFRITIYSGIKAHRPFPTTGQWPAWVRTDGPILKHGGTANSSPAPPGRNRRSTTADASANGHQHQVV